MHESDKAESVQSFLAVQKNYPSIFRIFLLEEGKEKAEEEVSQEKLKEDCSVGRGLLGGTTAFCGVLAPAFSGFVIGSGGSGAVTILSSLEVSCLRQMLTLSIHNNLSG